MKQLKLILILSLFTMSTYAQVGYKIGEVTRWWTPKHIQVTDGLTVKYKLYNGYDTAYRYNIGPDPDTFDVVVTFKKRLPPAPKPDLVSVMDDYTIVPNQTYLPATRLSDNVYSSTAWAHMKGQTWNANHYANTVSFVEGIQVGAYVELTCVCYKVEWWGERRNNHGIVSITTDGGAIANVDTYGPNTDNPSTLFWTSAAAPVNGTHKFRVTYTGTKNPASTSFSIVHDKWVIYTKQP